MESRKKLDPQAVAFGRRMQRLRKRAGLSQEQVAKLLDRHVNTIQKWEAGKEAMRALDLPLLAAAIGTTSAALLGDRCEQLDIPTRRTETVYFVSRDAMKRIENARTIDELRDLYSQGIAAGVHVPIDAEEVTAEEWGRIEAKLEARLAELGDIPEDW